ncbi:MAG: hypothetical protein H6719_37325 [Sandaracinaceae bacterium]|nr:hypothetical protein [Sandaracinaceae bacterium]
MDRRLSWAIGLLLIGACGGGDDSNTPPPPPPPPAAPSVAIGVPATVTIAPMAAGGQADSMAVNLDFNVAAPGNYQCTAHGVQGTEVRDAQMKLFQNGAELAMDSDSGDGFDAMITRQLAPGAYSIRVWEWLGRDAQITVTCGLAPAVPVNPTVLTVGTPVNVNVAAAQGPAGQVDLNLVIAAPGNYQCDATSSMDAQMAILQNGATLQEDSDGGEGVNSRITRELAPGAYVVRVWEWQHREAQISVNCAPAVSAPVVADGGLLVLGTPAAVNVPAGEGPAGQVHLNLVIAAPGQYTCDATDTSHDAQMAIVQGGNVIVEDSDSGEGTNSRITQTLAPGAYQIRVWEWLHRATQITVTCRQG